MRRRRAAILAVALLASAGCTGGGNGGPDGGPGGVSIEVVRFDLDSELLGITLEEVGLKPPPLGRGLRAPLVVLLHGRGASPEGVIRRQNLIQALEAMGGAAPAVVIADGGEASYYHDRDSGPWGTHIVEELIPEAAARLDADPSLVAIGGESMGGFGALDIARLWPDRFCAVGGHSPALFRTGADTPQGAFDDAEDFAEHDLMALAESGRNPYGGTPVWLDVGESDPFRPVVTAFAGLLADAGADVRFEVRNGGHNDEYWHHGLPRYLHFYGESLAGCL